MNTKNEPRGFLLIAALLFAMVLAAFVTSVLTQGIAMRKQTRYQGAIQRANYAAESGIHYAVAKLSGPERKALLDAGWHQGVLQGSGERAPRYYLTIQDGLESDGNDNDQDGIVDEAEEAEMLELTSRGDYDGIGRTVRVTLLARFQVPNIPGATYFHDPLASIGLNGNAFKISGYDIDLADQPTGVVKPGVVVNGGTADLMAQIRSQEYDNVIGLGGTPSVVAAEEPLDFRALVEQGARVADITLPSGTTLRPDPDNPGEWGTIEDPKILYAPNGAQISSSESGAGLLIVNGDLDISGGFQWSGLVIVQGQVKFSGGGNGTRVRGALVVSDDVFVIRDPNTGMTTTGTVDINLSEEAVQKLLEAFKVYTVINWREGPNPPLEALP